MLPDTQQVAPVQLEPPHCPYLAMHDAVEVDVADVVVVVVVFDVVVLEIVVVVAVVVVVVWLTVDDIGVVEVFDTVVVL